jgi:3-deoxy-D-manno-octulosonic-acid transferase
VVSTTTAAGFQLAQAKFPGQLVFYCPLDFSWAVSAAMRRIRPQLLVLGELELWPNLIMAARRRGAKVAVVNGRLSQSSWRGYQYIRPLIAYVLRGLDFVGVQTAEYQERFLQLGARPDTVHVTGSLKFDGAETNRDNPATRRLTRLAQLADDDVVFLAGSTQAPEESLALGVFRDLHRSYPQLRLILVPRHAQRFSQVARLLERAKIPWQLRSQLQTNGANPEARVLLVDTIGELGAWWGTAHIAFVGGSLGRRGGQNMIEPAAYGAAVSFGPNTRNFRDVVSALQEAGAAVLVANGLDLNRFVSRCLQDANYRTELGRRAQQLVRQHSGATAITVTWLREVLSGSRDAVVDRGQPHRGSPQYDAASPLPRTPSLRLDACSASADRHNI